jgi:hypothetical protein
MRPEAEVPTDAKLTVLKTREELFRGSLLIRAYKPALPNLGELPKAITPVGSIHMVSELSLLSTVAIGLPPNTALTGTGTGGESGDTRAHCPNPTAATTPPWEEKNSRAGNGSLGF